MNRKVITTLIIVAVMTVCGAVTAGSLAYVVLTNATKIEGVKTISDQLAGMPELQSKMIKAYPSDSIEIQVTNGHILEINMVNSGFLDLSELRRQAKAKEIAVFIMKNYDAINTIDTISITFTDRIVVGLEFSKFLTYIYYTNDLR